MILTWLGRTNTPWFGRQSKYDSPCTDPLFFPVGVSLLVSGIRGCATHSSMPTHRPDENFGLTPFQRTIPTPAITDTLAPTGMLSGALIVLDGESPCCC